MKRMIGIGLVLFAALLLAAPALAQDSVSAPASRPASYALNGVTHIYQDWNNCGPATLTMALTYFGIPADQYPAAAYLKPNYEDKNVSPWQLVEYVNTQLPGTLRAIERQGGTVDGLKNLIAAQFPVLVEAGYDPATDDQGWMGHYLFVSGYDDGRGVFITQDSFEGANVAYEYAYLDEYWRHFNRLYIVIYDVRREAELFALLGEDADERENTINALEAARAEAIADRGDPWAWFNMGTNFTRLEMYPEAATAYDQARNLGLPFRMAWYQFGWYEAYLQMGRYDDVIALAGATLNDGGGQYVEETYYYAALAREAMGERARAIDNLNAVIAFNPNFTAARTLRDQLSSG
ncbi:MAG: C39 family peptidase [bacterium]|nr:C39 family peptidase [bacterium]